MVARYICLLFLLLFPLFIPAQNAHRAQKDSLRRILSLTAGREKLDTYYHLSQLYKSEVKMEPVRDTLLALYDEWDAEARKQGNIQYRALIRTRKSIYLN
jgi:hypothetical protein